VSIEWEAVQLQSLSECFGGLELAKECVGLQVKMSVVVVVVVVVIDIKMVEIDTRWYPKYSGLVPPSTQHLW
jgi:hypothetical protein